MGQRAGIIGGVFWGTKVPQQPVVQMLVVDAASEGQRVDNFLLKTLKGVPKSHTYRLIRDGQVRVNKGRVQAQTRLALGDVVRVPPVRIGSAAQAQALVPAAEFEVLFEDAAMLAINKPSGIAVHGGSGLSFGVIEQLRRARAQAPLLELVHRLDKETSGILLIAKRRSALTDLQNQFRGRQLEKRYLALVQGIWPPSQRVIDLHLFKYLLDNGERRVKVVDADHVQAQRSVSLVRVLAVADDADHPLGARSLLEVNIKTGRTHQIRVHLAHAGHPIAGDDKYGDFAWNKRLSAAGLRRMYLHAQALKFHHPSDHRPINLTADIPPELRNWSLGFVANS